MSDIDSLQGEVHEVSEEVLSDLSSEERVQAFVREAAAGNEEFLDKLDDTAPQYDYRAQDLDYFTQIQKLEGVSLQARFELQTRYQSIKLAETNRDKHAALALLNQSLCRCTGETVAIDEFGQIEAPSQSDGESTNDHAGSSRMADLAFKDRALWEETPHDFLLEEDGRVDEYLSSLAASGLPGNLSDYWWDSYDEFSPDHIPSKLYQSEIRLVYALLDFQNQYHGWRIFAEEELCISLDELLQITMTEQDGGNGPVVRNDISILTEQLRETTPKLNQQYAWFEPALLDCGDEGEEQMYDEARANRFAAEMAEAVDY